MYRTLAILCLVAPAFAYVIDVSGPLVPGLKYKLGAPGEGSRDILNIPLSNISASVRGYYLMNRPRLPGGYCSLQLWCRPDEDYRVCIFTDETGDVAGVQINIPMSDFKPRYDMREQGFTTWTTKLRQQIVRFHAIYVLFVPPDSQKRIESKDVTVVLRDDKVYYSGFGGYLDSMSTNESELNSSYIKQDCLMWIGDAYYRNMTEDLICTPSTLSPFSASYYDGKLIAVKLTAFGHFKKGSKYPPYFEDVNAVRTKHDVPTGPDCLFTEIAAYGAIGRTIYLTTTPWRMTCTDQD